MKNLNMLLRGLRHSAAVPKLSAAIPKLVCRVVVKPPQIVVNDNNSYVQQIVDKPSHGLLHTAATFQIDTETLLKNSVQDIPVADIVYIMHHCGNSTLRKHLPHLGA